MADYIDREAAIDAVTAVYVRTAGYKTRERVWETREAIQKLPTAEEPVRHGRWLWHEESFDYECSDCHCRFDYNKTYELFDHGFQFANYCPYCGAKMDGGAEDAAD